jgi:HNH endonuclease
MSTTMRKDDGDALILKAAAGCILDNRLPDAAALLRGLQRDDPLPLPEVTSTMYSLLSGATEGGSPPAVPLRARVLEAGCWCCEYCDRRLVVPGVIELIGRLFPHEFPFSSHHMPTTRTHPAAIRVYPNIDHVIAKSVGGKLVDSNNLVAACTPCNERKSNRGGWDPSGVIREADWKGITDDYRRLLELVRPQNMRFHNAWLNALKL